MSECVVTMPLLWASRRAGDVSSPQVTAGLRAFIGGVATSVLDTVSDMDDNDVDPTEHPDYLTLSDAGKECGVSTKVLQKLIRERKIVEGAARTQRGTPYLHREHVPSWSQVEAIPTQRYLQQLARVDKAVKALETEIEAVRFDLNEAHTDPDGPLGDDLRAAADLSFDERSRSLSGVTSKLSREVMTLVSAKTHLDDLRDRV